MCWEATGGLESYRELLFEYTVAAASDRYEVGLRG